MKHEKYISVEEAAKVLHCSTHTVRTMIRKGTLRASRRRGGRGWIIAEADALACLEEYRPEAPARTRTQASASHLAAMEELRKAGIG